MIATMDMKTLRNAIPWTISDSMDEGVLDEFEKTLSEDNGQTLHCSLMEPCPFCGGTPFIQTHQMGDAGWESRAVCQSCHVSTSYEWQSWGMGRTEPFKDYTRLIAIAKTVIVWNERHEPCDRDALLELASELEDQQTNKGIRMPGPYMEPGEAARRIREACGEKAIKNGD